MRTTFVALFLAAACVVGCNPFGRGRVDRATGLPIADVPQTGSRWLSPQEVMQQAREYQEQGHQGQHGGECPHCARGQRRKRQGDASYELNVASGQCGGGCERGGRWR